MSAPDVDWDRELAKRLRRAVALSGRTQADIARQLGVSAQAVSNWLRDGQMSKVYLVPFCRACGVCTDWLLTGEGQAEMLNPLSAYSDDQVIGYVLERLGRLGRAELLRRFADLI